MGSATPSPGSIWINRSTSYQFEVCSVDDGLVMCAMVGGEEANPQPLEEFLAGHLALADAEPMERPTL